MTALYANENFPLQVVEALRVLGHDVLTALAAGQANQAIAADLVLAFAAQNGRAVLTLNRRDFIRLHQQQSEHFGIIVCTEEADSEAQAERIHQTILQNEPLSGKLVRVYRAAA